MTHDYDELERKLKAEYDAWSDESRKQLPLNFRQFQKLHLEVAISSYTEIVNYLQEYSKFKGLDLVDLRTNFINTLNKAEET